jgi:hypothetical protein
MPDRSRTRGCGSGYVKQRNQVVRGPAHNSRDIAEHDARQLGFFARTSPRRRDVIDQDYGSLGRRRQSPVHNCVETRRDGHRDHRALSRSCDWQGRGHFKLARCRGGAVRPLATPMEVLRRRAGPAQPRRGSFECVCHELEVQASNSGRLAGKPSKRRRRPFGAPRSTVDLYNTAELWLSGQCLAVSVAWPHTDSTARSGSRSVRRQSENARSEP